MRVDASGAISMKMRRTGKHKWRTRKSEAPPPVAPQAAPADLAQETPQEIFEDRPHEAFEELPQEDEEERFFSDPPREPRADERSFRHYSADDEPDEPDELELELAAQARARRRRFAKITQVAIVASVLVCLLALTRMIAARDRVPLVPVSTAAQNEPPRVAPPSPPVPREAPPARAVTTTTTASAATALTAPEPPAASSMARAGHEEAALRDPAAAAAERFEARAALDVGDLRRAQRVAQRSVDHDPREADGWLLLVAAHSAMGEGYMADRALAGCAKYATRGPRGECFALMRRR